MGGISASTIFVIAAAVGLVATLRDIIRGVVAWRQKNELAATRLPVQAGREAVALQSKILEDLREAYSEQVKMADDYRVRWQQAESASVAKDAQIQDLYRIIGQMRAEKEKP